MFVGERPNPITLVVKEPRELNRNPNSGLFVFDTDSASVNEVIGLDKIISPMKPIFDQSGHGIVCIGSEMPGLLYA